MSQRKRKIDDQKLLELIKQKKTQKEAARILKVSEPAVCKRLKRLCPPPETPHFNQLTDKEKIFVLEKVKGKNSLQAVLNSFEVTSRESAKVIGSQLMAKPEIQMSITELMEHCGMGKPYRIRRLKNIIDSSDLNIAHKGLDTSFKLSGDFAPEKHMNMNLNCQISESEERELREIARQMAEKAINELNEVETVQNNQPVIDGEIEEGDGD